MDCEYLWTDIDHLGGGGLQCTVGTEVMLHEWQDMDIVELGHEGGDIHQHTRLPTSYTHDHLLQITEGLDRN